MLKLRVLQLQRLLGLDTPLVSFLFADLLAILSFVRY